MQNTKHCFNYEQTLFSKILKTYFQRFVQSQIETTSLPVKAITRKGRLQKQFAV